MQPPQPYSPPPLPQPQRAGWGRFWLGVLAGGCAVVALEGLAFLLLFVVLGAAVGSLVRQSGSGGTLPGLPGAALPNLAQRSDPCGPQPCMAHGGVAVYIANVNRSAGPATANGAHLVKLDLTFVGTSGTHTVTPESVAIEDPAGSMVLAGVDQAAGQCGDASVSQEVTSGQRAGPFTVCYAVTGAASAPLTLVWVDPEDLSVVQLKLP